ncbi:alpha-galactosidase [Diaminobutyricibacter tongyongensis]|uniref:Alpha-galactosidase n=1 Tax=Leifsonia tongyongensis TaxID=1268043 RepID=A0A6L9XV66_9MICO|nr:alpha-galactosidase [Diaminobutyricibacter tongyongensis]NEN05322.1 alpha-galactosidase [Diaminobutyricibacter tongyongensis]
MSDRLYWGNGTLTIELEWSPDAAPSIAAIHGAGATVEMPAGLPLIDILTVSHGHRLANDRLVHTAIGHASRYVEHEELVEDGLRTLRVTVAHPATGIIATMNLTLYDRLAVIRSTVTVTNSGGEPVALRSVPSFSAYLGGDGSSDIRDWTIQHALSDWLGEGRWISEALDGVQFPRLEQHLTNHNPRGEFSVTSSGTWSTGKHLPVASVTSERLGAAWAWQIEHNGAWRWEIGEDTASGYLALSGPTDTDHHWMKMLDPGDTFTTVPVSLAFARDFASAMSELTGYRRAARRSHPDNRAMPVVFNDYMNTLNGDPTTEKLLPLIASAAEAGAEIFCIDAGWYDDSGDWWDTVGEWRPSTTRFPGGLGEVIDRISAAGMIPGLWLEPEVIGVNSPAAWTLPDEAFLQRNGKRVVEHDRYHLDLRHPIARAHLDEVIDRLVNDYRVGFFKLDYNINPGPGTDRDADSVGDGLLQHNRAHLDWIDGVLERHPELVLENCGSGAMRSDFAMLSRMQLQSTSDQQDYLKYPPIAAAAPAAMLPEQAASWAYPQPEMTREEMSFCLATGLLGRFYLSGYLNRMDEDQRGLVREAVTAAKHLAPELTQSRPFWPLGLPTWEGAWTALGLATDGSRLITLWNRSPEDDVVTLDLPELASSQFTLHTIFPRSQPEWNSDWDSEAGKLRVQNPTGTVGARVFRIDVV